MYLNFPHDFMFVHLCKPLDSCLLDAVAKIFDITLKIKSTVSYLAHLLSLKGRSKRNTYVRTLRLTKIVIAIAGIPQFLNQLLERISRGSKEANTLQMPHLVPRVVLDPVDEVGLFLEQVRLRSDH